MSYKDRLPDSYMIEEGNNLSKITGSPIYIDTQDSKNIYLGYGRIDKTLNKDEGDLLIKKININDDLITMYYAYGVWEDRLSLQYK